MNLTAKEQYELVKDHPEVWRNVLDYDTRTGARWTCRSRRYTLPNDLSALTLTALFMLAAECGVGHNPVTKRHYAFEYHRDIPDTGTENGPLAAAVAAYKRRSGT